MTTIIAFAAGLVDDLKRMGGWFKPLLLHVFNYCIIDHMEQITIAIVTSIDQHRRLLICIVTTIVLPIYNYYIKPPYLCI